MKRAVKLLDSQSGFQAAARDLTGGVHAGVGTSGADHVGSGAGDLLERLAETALHGATRVGLALPTFEVGAVVFQYEAEGLQGVRSGDPFRRRRVSTSFATLEATSRSPSEASHSNNPRS